MKWRLNLIRVAIKLMVVIKKAIKGAPNGIPYRGQGRGFFRSPDSLMVIKMPLLCYFPNLLIWLLHVQTAPLKFGFLFLEDEWLDFGG